MSSVTDYTVANVSIIINYIPIRKFIPGEPKKHWGEKNDSFVISVAKVSKNSVSFRNIWWSVDILESCRTLPSKWIIYDSRSVPCAFRFIIVAFVCSECALSHSRNSTTFICRSQALCRLALARTISLSLGPRAMYSTFDTITSRVLLLLLILSSAVQRIHWIIPIVL